MTAITNDSIDAAVQRKICKRCGKDLPLSEYHKDSTKAKGDGRRSICRHCRSERVLSRPQSVRTPEEQLKSEARAAALKTLVERHHREFAGLCRNEYSARGIGPRWVAVS